VQNLDAQTVLAMGFQETKQRGEKVKKRCSIIGLLVLSAVLLAGCAHNMATYGDGVGFHTTLNPQTYTFGFDFFYGKILQVIIKDNTKINLAANGKLNNTTSTETDTTAAQDTAIQAPAELTIETGNQVTGYEVELVKELKSNPEAMKVWMEARKRFAIPATSPPATK